LLWSILVFIVSNKLLWHLSTVASDKISYANFEPLIKFYMTELKSMFLFSILFFSIITLILTKNQYNEIENFDQSTFLTNLHYNQPIIYSKETHQQYQDALLLQMNAPSNLLHMASPPGKDVVVGIICFIFRDCSYLHSHWCTSSYGLY
jgi:hypothetical protein